MWQICLLFFPLTRKSMLFLSVCLVLATFFSNFISPTHLWRVWVLGTRFGCINTLGWPITQPSVYGSATVSSCDLMPILARQWAEPSAMPPVSGYRASKRSRCSYGVTWQQPLACKESWFGSSQLTRDSLIWTLCVQLQLCLPKSASVVV